MNSSSKGSLPFHPDKTISYHKRNANYCRHGDFIIFHFFRSFPKSQKFSQLKNPKTFDPSPQTFRMVLLAMNHIEVIPNYIINHLSNTKVTNFGTIYSIYVYKKFY